MNGRHEGGHDGCIAEIKTDLLRRRGEAGLFALGHALADGAGFRFDERPKARAIERLAVNGLERDHDTLGLSQHVHGAFSVGGELRLGGWHIAKRADLDRPVAPALGGDGFGDAGGGTAAHRCSHVADIAFTQRFCARGRAYVRRRGALLRRQ